MNITSTCLALALCVGTSDTLRGPSFQISLEGKSPTQCWILVLNSWWGSLIFLFNKVRSKQRSSKMSPSSCLSHMTFILKITSWHSNLPKLHSRSQTRDPQPHDSHGHCSKIRVDFVTVVYYRHGNSLQLSGP